MYISDETGKLIAGNIENMEVDTDSIVTALQDITSALEDISPVGKMTYLIDRKTSAQAETSTSGNYINLLQLSLTEGTWIISATAVYPSNATGYRQAFIVDDPDTNSPANTMTAIQAAFSGTNNNVNLSGVYTSSGNKTIYLRCRQNSGQDLNVYGVLNAVKIL